MSPLLRFALDLGPLGVFFVAYQTAGLLPATGALIAATLVSVTVGYIYEKKLAPMPLITAGAVTFFGTLTLVMHDELFIKMKPTFVNLLFAALLLGGVLRGKPLLKYLLQAAIQLTDEGWRALSFRWGVYFLFLAALNEVIWRNFSTDFWVSFKVFGMFTLTLLFTAAQIPLMKRTMIEETPPSQEG